MEQELMRIGVSIPDNLLGRFDEIMDKRGYSSRSEGIRDAVRNYILYYEWMSEVEGERLGLITIIYGLHKKGLVRHLNSIQHDHLDLIRSSVQAHLDRDRVMEVMIVRGDAKNIVDFAEKLMASKGVKYLKLTTVLPGLHL
jgi:CopG family nickel-responsive transcriptional regulator